jgi:hypothetical protein
VGEGKGLTTDERVLLGCGVRDEYGVGLAFRVRVGSGSSVAVVMGFSVGVGVGTISPATGEELRVGDGITNEIA